MQCVFLRMLTMKIVKVIYLILSIILVLFLVFNIVDSYVSLKYEIYEYRILFNKEFVPTERAEEYILRLIRTLKFFLYYVLITVVLIIMSFIQQRKN